MPDVERSEGAESEALLRSILDSSLDGIMALRAIRDVAGGRIVDLEWVLLNRRAATLLGRTSAALVGRRLLQEMPGHAIEGLFEQYVQVIESGEPFAREHYYEHERTRAWFQTVAVRLGDGVAITFADISDRKGLEEQLVQSQKMEVLGRLAGGIAHDFNNLLTAIGVNAELAVDMLGNAEAGRQELDGVLDGVRRAGSLTQQLLTFARQQVVSPRPVRVIDVVQHSTPMLRRLLASTVEFVVREVGHSGTVSVDPIRFEQVLTNLTVNAGDAMPNGGTLTFEVSDTTVRPDDPANIRRVSPGEYVRIEAADTGVGIPAEILPRIFEPFFTTKGAGRGTGLGLATSFGAIRQAGGTMWATSILARGSTFTILLPRVHIEAEPWPPTAPGGAMLRGTESVLVVDDEPSVRTTVARTLRRFGYRVATAANGEEARRRLEETPDLDLVLADIAMPRVSGRDLQATVHERYPHLKVMLMSGFDPGTSSDADTVLRKPFTAGELTAALRSVLDAPRA